MSYIITFSQENNIYSKSHHRIKFVYLLILLIILFSILYIIQANNVATAGYKIQEDKNKLMSLGAENKNLELKLSEVQSPAYLETTIAKLDMVKMEKIEYLSPVSEVAAK